MNMSLVNGLADQVVKYICDNIADELENIVLTMNEEGKEPHDITAAIREHLQAVHSAIPKTTAPVATASAKPPAASSAAAASSSRTSGGSSSRSTDKDKIKINGEVVKCCAVTKKEKTPCKHDAKHEVDENGVKKYYCGVHHKQGAVAQADPKDRPGANRGKPAQANSTFLAAVATGTEFANLDLSNVEEINA